MDSLRVVFTEQELKVIRRVLDVSPTPFKPIHPLIRSTRALLRLYAVLWLIGRRTRIKLANAGCLSIVVLRSVHFAAQKLISNELSAGLASGLAGVVLAWKLPVGVSTPLTVYLGGKLVEYVFAWAEDRNLLPFKRFVGSKSWILFPLAYSQLLSTAFTAPELAPPSFKRVLGLLSFGAFSPHTDNLLKVVPLASNLAPFQSSLVAPTGTTTVTAAINALPSSLETTTRLLTAHPNNSSVLGALLHPEFGSGSEFFTAHVLHNAKMLSQYLFPAYLARAVLLPSASASSVTPRRALATAARTVAVYTLVSSTTVGLIELSARILGQKRGKSRFRLIGLLSGLFAFLNRQTGKTQYLSITRLSILTLIPISKRRRVVRLVLPVVCALVFWLAKAHPQLVPRILRSAIEWCLQGDLNGLD